MKMEDIENLRRKIREAEAEAERAAGALQETMRQIQEEFGCEDLAQAQTILDGLEEEEKRIQQRLDRELEKFRKKWGDKLDEYDL